MSSALCNTDYFFLSKNPTQLFLLLYTSVAFSTAVDRPIALAEIAAIVASPDNAE